MKGILCKDDEAEKLMLDSLRIAETSTFKANDSSGARVEILGPDGPVTAMHHLDLARFYHSRKMSDKAAPFF